MNIFIGWSLFFINLGALVYVIYEILKEFKTSWFDNSSRVISERDIKLEKIEMAASVVGEKSMSISNPLRDSTRREHGSTSILEKFPQPIDGTSAKFRIKPETAADSEEEKVTAAMDVNNGGATEASKD